MMAWMVMRLFEEGKTDSGPIKLSDETIGLMGLIPVFSTQKAALKEARRGPRKIPYDVIKIAIGDPVPTPPKRKGSSQ